MIFTLFLCLNGWASPTPKPTSPRAITSSDFNLKIAYQEAVTGSNSVIGQGPMLIVEGTGVNF